MLNLEDKFELSLDQIKKIKDFLKHKDSEFDEKQNHLTSVNSEQISVIWVKGYPGQSL